MKIVTILAAVILATAAAAGAYWISRGSDPAAASASGSDDPLAPSKTGPHPKAVVSGETFDFGKMAIGETRKHVFVIKNEGQAPLKLGEPELTCQCTVSKLSTREVPPGVEATIEMEWKPEVTALTFSKGGTIRTNDPKMPTVSLFGEGLVDELIRVEPSGSWNLGQIVGDIPNDQTGIVYSRLLDRFEIRSIDSTNPLLSASAEPAPPAALAEHEALSGYLVKAKLAPGMPVGRFVEKLTIRTDQKNEKYAALTFEVIGVRQGPIQIVPLPGTAWNSALMAVDLGRFPAADGAKAGLSLFVSGLPADEHLTFASVKTSEDSLSVELKRDDEFKSPERQRYVLTFEVPKGRPPATHRSKSAVKIEAVTNHPNAEEVNFLVQYVSTP